MELERLINIIREGESERVEFKLKVGTEIEKEISAFANSEGGIIVIGVVTA